MHSSEYCHYVLQNYSKSVNFKSQKCVIVFYEYKEILFMCFVKVLFCIMGFQDWSYIKTCLNKWHHGHFMDFEIKNIRISESYWKDEFSL